MLRWVSFSAASASPPTRPPDFIAWIFRIPVEHHLVFLEVGCAPYHWQGSGTARRSGRARACGTRRRTPMLTPLIVFLSRIVLSFCVPRFLITGQQELDTVIVGGQPLFVEEVPELRHVVGMDAEDAERLEHTDVSRLLDAFGESGLAAALEAQVVALEPNAAPEELDDLRAFPPSHVHQAHGRDAPTAPALGELLRPDQQVYRGVRLTDLVEERP